MRNTFKPAFVLLPKIRLTAIKSAELKFAMITAVWLLVTGCATSPKSIGIPETTIPDLLANRAAYQGHRVHITGFCLFRFEHSVIHPDRFSRNGIWLAPRVKPGCEPKIEWRDGYARAVGTFVYHPRGDGHMGQWPGELTDLELLEPLLTGAPDFRGKGGGQLLMQVPDSVKPIVFGEAHAARPEDSQLFDAMNANDARRLKRLLRNGMDPNSRDDSDRPAIYWAIEKDDVRLLKLLIDFGAAVNWQSATEPPPLLCAAAGWTPQIVDLLLRRGANVNAREDERGVTALMTAAGHPHFIFSRAEARALSKEELRICRLLVRAGADVNATDKDGKTALDYAGERPIADLLLKHGAKHGQHSEARETM